MYIPAIVMVSFYFEERRALATGQYACVVYFKNVLCHGNCLSFSWLWSLFSTIFIVCIAYIIDEDFSNAGITVCGSGIGTFIFAPLTEYLLSVYDWKGAMTVIAGLVLQGAVAGALFKPIKKCKHKYINKYMKYEI